MPYYGDSSPYYYSGSSAGPFANHSSLISSIGRYHNPIAARYSPHLSTISETPFVSLRRYSPSVPTSATTSLSRPRRIIDTADIDVSKPPSRNLDQRHQQQRHRLRRDRPTIKIRSQALKDNPALREYNERHEKTVGEMLVEKFLIKDKSARDVEPPKMKLYHQASLMRDAQLDVSKDRQNDILAAIRHRITRKMTRRRSSVDAIPLDPEQIEREVALQAAQAEALDTLVAEELAEAQMEVRQGTFTKRHSLVPLPQDISEASDTDDEAAQEERKSTELLRKHATAKKKRRRKSIDKYSQSDEEDTFSIAESIIEEEEFEWDDREKCDDVKKIMPKDELKAVIKIPEQTRAVSPRMEKKEQLDQVGHRLKELRKEVRKLDKKERDIKQEKSPSKENEKEKVAEIVKPKAEMLEVDVVELKANNLEVDKVKEEKIIPQVEKTEEVSEEDNIDKREVLTNKDEAEKELSKKEILEPEMDETKKEMAKLKEKETAPSKKDVDTVKVEETKIFERKDDGKNLRSDKSDVTSAGPAKMKEDITTEPKKILEAKDKDETSQLPKDDRIVLKEVVAPKTSEPALEKSESTAKSSETPSKDDTRLKVKERKIKEKSAKPDRTKLKRTSSATQQLPTEAQSPCFKVEACNSVGDFSSLYVKSAASPEDLQSIEQFRESIRLPAPKIRTAIETEVVLPVRKPYVRDTSRNSVYLALKPMRKDVDAKSSDMPSVISEEGELSIDHRQVVDEKSSRAQGAKEEFVSWWDDIPEDKVAETVLPKKLEVEAKDKAEKKVEIVVQKKTDVKASDQTVEPVVEKKAQVKQATPSLNKVKVESAVAKKTEVNAETKTVTNKIADKVVKAVDKKLENKVDDKTIVDKIAEVIEPLVGKKLEVKADEKIEGVKAEPIAEKKSNKINVDEKITEAKSEVKQNDNVTSDEKIIDISVKAQLDDKSPAEKKAKATDEPSTATKEAPEKVRKARAVKETSEQHPEAASHKKSWALPKAVAAEGNDDKTITRTCDSNNKTSTAQSCDVTHIVEEEAATSTTIIAAKRDERKRKVDAQAIMKIEKRILEEAESPDKILTTALPDKKEEPHAEKSDLHETKKQSAATEIDFWNEIEPTASVELQLQQTNRLKLDLTRIDQSLQDDLPTPLIKDQDMTPLVEEPATPLQENLRQVPPVNLQLTEEERRSTVKYNGVKEDEQLDELSATVKKISKWGNHDNLTSLDTSVTAVTPKEVSPAVSTTSSVAKKKVVKKKKSTTTKKSGESAKKTSAKTKTPVKKAAAAAAAATPQPSQLKSTAAMSASSASPRNTPVQRPADLQKLFYTTPAILLTATPRDLRKVRRAKAKKKKPPTRTPSLSSDSTGSTRSTATTSTEEGSNCEEDAEQKRLNSTRSNDSGFDGSPRLSNCDMVCHKKCEKLTGNLCGLNQKLVAEALQALKKGPTYTRAGRKSFVRRRLRPYGYAVDAYQQLPPQESPSQSSENQRNADGDHFHHSGRITPPATNLPRFKKYEVTDFNFLKVLGKGSFGKVLLAELRGTECVYAVKCLKKDVVLEDDDVECTLIERKVLTLATRHPYLCHLFCTFQTESHLFFVMEYLNGGDLMFHIQKSGRFTEPRAKFYAAEIWSGLIFLHKKGIVYRDLKLDNVLLDFEGHIRIADFGMCKLQIFLDRTADTFCGTPDYMAPEIIKGLKYNQAVDWWSFGVLLYEMLTGQSPFSGCDEDELFWSICNERPFIPRYLSQSSTEILVCLLEKDAGKRIPGHEIACHPFFCNISWEKLERRVLEPPFKPAVEHTLDTRYFDTAFTTERPRLTPVPEEILTSMDQAVFRGFSYTNPNATD